MFVCLIMRYDTLSLFFFFNDTATTEIYTLSLHDALPISINFAGAINSLQQLWTGRKIPFQRTPKVPGRTAARSEEHTSELQSRLHLVCRLLLEKKKTKGVFEMSGTYPHARRAEILSRPAA